MFAWRSLSSYFYLLPLAVLLVILERSREEEQEGSTLATGELLALLALAMVTLNIATGFEGFLMWGDLVAHSLSPEDRLGHASMALMLSTLGIGLLVTAAWGRVGARRPFLRFFLRIAGFLPADSYRSAAH